MYFEGYFEDCRSAVFVGSLSKQVYYYVMTSYVTFYFYCENFREARHDLD